MPRTIDIAEKISQLRSFHRQEGRAPSYAEMVALLGYKSKNAVYNPVSANKTFAVTLAAKQNKKRIQKANEHEKPNACEPQKS
jgi:hypothetical protein